MIRILAFLVLLASQADARERLEAIITPGSGTVGDRLKYEITIPPDIDKMQIPQNLENPAPFEVIGGELQEAEGSRKIVFTLTVMETGRHKLPVYRLEWEEAGGERHKAETEPMFVQIISVLPPDEENPELADIENELEAKIDWMEYIIPAAIALAIIIAIIALIYYLKKRGQKPVVKTEPSIPPYEAAIKRLEDISRRDAYSAGQVKEYFTEIADTVRTYIEDEYGLDAMEKTTYELNHAWPSFLAEHKVRVISYLELCDAAKFAKALPGPDDAKKTLEEAFGFVRISIKDKSAKQEEMAGDLKSGRV